MFKQLVLGAVLFGNALASFAGQYDGVWHISGDTAYSLVYTDASGLALLVSVEPGSDGLWGSWSGTGIGSLSGNVISGTVDQPESTLSATITFSSPSAGTLLVKSCSAKRIGGCSEVPLNTPIPFSRVL